MNNSHLISAVVLCRNESKFIKSCIDSLLSFYLPDNVAIEILVVDGMSTDGTREIVQGISLHDPRVELIDNPDLLHVFAFNKGFQMASGEWVMIVNAHSIYPQNYLKTCLETALRTRADNVGGILLTQPRGISYQAMLVQALTTHKFGVGNSGFRVGDIEGESDTVPYGFYKKDVVKRIGWFDQRLIRCQDYEFNRRLGAAGGKIWRNPEIQLNYYNQPDLMSFYKKQIIHEAPYNPYMWYLAPYAFAYRHGITGIFALGVLGGLLFPILFSILGTALTVPFLFTTATWIATLFGIVIAFYFTLGILSAIQQAIRYKYWQHVLVLPICFFLYHFLHGLGILWGLLRLATGTAPVQKIPEPWPGAGRKRAWGAS